MTIQEAQQKRILDACCGSKMFWFDKNNPDVVYTDIREVPYHEYYPGRYIEIAPDIICDFQRLPFANDTFHLVVFDPPHLPDAGDTSIMALKYGCLKGDWKEQLSKGFDECMRVLRPNGILIFKWSEQRIALADILKCFSQRPLFGNRCRKKGNTTHWLCFMKDEPILSQADRKTEPQTMSIKKTMTGTHRERIEYTEAEMVVEDEPQTERSE
jgi:SAM-dependent methyltransferase